MSTETARRWRRSEVAKELRDAAAQLRKAADKLTTAAVALAAVETARDKVAEATKQAQHPVLGGVQKVRSGLPAPLRKRIETKAGQLEDLARDVRAWTITRDEKALAQRAKATKGAGGGKPDQAALATRTAPQAQAATKPKKGVSVDPAKRRARKPA